MDLPTPLSLDPSSPGRFPPWLMRRAPLLLFLAFYALTVALTYRGFGTTWDEGDVYVRGARLLQTLKTGEPGRLVEKLEDPDGNLVYNHSYAMVLNLLNPTIDLDAFHGLNLTVASLGYIAAYELTLTATGGPWAALLGPLCLLLNPRFSGDTPANPKDAPYAVFHLVFLWGLVALPGRRFVLKTALLALCLFFAVSLRVSGLALLLPAVLWMTWLSPREDRPTPAQGALSLFLMTALTLSALVATWPYLRLAPWAHLKEVVALALDFPYNGDTLFQGQVLKVHDLPASYPWVWLNQAVPTGWILLSGAALLLLARWKAPAPTRLIGLTLLLELAVLLLTRPALYDGLRHLLFLLPLISVLSAWALGETWRRLPQGALRHGFVAVLALYGASLAFQMAALHPYEYLYFNGRSGGLRAAQGRFETDYWGASYREAALWLREHELLTLRRPFNLHTKGNAIQTLVYLVDLPVRWTALEEADYLIASTRWKEHLLAGDRPPLHVVSREGVPLCYVFKMR